MSISLGKVGIAPGTTTLNIGSGGGVNLVGSHLGASQRFNMSPRNIHTRQDPGVTVHNAYGDLMGAQYFDARPTDFDQAYRRGYLPVQRGWITGTLSGGGLGACCSSCAVGGPCGSELGEEVATVSNGTGLDPNQQEAIAKLIMVRLAAEEKTLELKERKSRMFWGTVAGIATGTTTVIALLSYFKKI